MAKLPCPITCECGYTTLHSEEAINHISDEHPEAFETQEVDALYDVGRDKIRLYSEDKHDR